MDIYPKPTKLAVFILTHLAHQNDDPFSVSDVTKLTGISAPTAAKTLHALAKDGILESRRGPGGGFRKAFVPQQLTLARIICAIEGEERFPKCIWGFSTCSDATSCPLHQKWKDMKEQLESFFHSTTIQDMVEVMEKQQGKYAKEEFVSLAD